MTARYKTPTLGSHLFPKKNLKKVSKTWIFFHLVKTADELSMIIVKIHRTPRNGGMSSAPFC